MAVSCSKPKLTMLAQRLPPCACYSAGYTGLAPANPQESLKNQTIKTQPGGFLAALDHLLFQAHNARCWA